MGYREGQGVGATGAGRAEPLDVVQKPGRTGLGVDEGRKRRKAEAAAGQQARGMSADMRCVMVGWSSDWKAAAAAAGSSRLLACGYCAPAMQTAGCRCLSLQLRAHARASVRTPKHGRLHSGPDLGHFWWQERSTRQFYGPCTCLAQSPPVGPVTHPTRLPTQM